MWRRQVTRKRLAQLLVLLLAIGIAFVLSLGNYEADNGKTGPTTSVSATHGSAAPSLP